MAVTVEHRFWAKVNKQPGDGCWLWTAACSDQGYGSFRISRRTHLAHRVAYEWLVGPVPEGLQLDHLCRVRNCVRPAHLEPVTGRINVLRGTSPAASHARKEACKNDHPFTTENTYVDPEGFRRCRACARGHQRRRVADGRRKYVPASAPTSGSVA